MFHLGVRNMPSLKNKIKVVMTVACANDLSGAAMQDIMRPSPILHPAIHNLLEGLSGISSLDIEVVFGKKHINANDCRKEGNITYTPIPYSPLPLPGFGWSYLARFNAIKKYIKTIHHDLIHAQGTERESGMIAAFSRKPSLLTIHGNFREISKLMPSSLWSYNRINAKLESIAIRKCTSILCISKYTQNSVIKLNPNTHLLPNAVSNRFFDIERNPISGRVVCVGSISERKNQIALLESCDKIAKIVPNFELHFWGDCNKKNNYTLEFYEKIEKRKWSRYLGVADHIQMLSLLSESELMVLPSIEDNCPVVLLEAMAAGLPIAASSVGGIPELISDGLTGILISPENMEFSANRILELLLSKFSLEQFSLSAKKLAACTFSPERIAKNHYLIYERLSKLFL